MSMVDWDIVRLTRRAGHLLSESTWEYWPTNGNNEIPERNISLHLTVAFAAAGFHPYAECHSGESTSQRTDLLLLQPDRRVLVVSESKRLYNSAKCSEVLHDFARIRDFVPRDREADGYQRFGLLTATTWDDRVACWWSSKDGEPPTTSDNWSGLRHHEQLQNARWGSVVLLGYEENRPLQAPFHYLLYTVFSLGSG